MSRLLALSHASLRARRPVLVAARLSGLLALKRQRTHLSQLDSKALADIGLTRREAETEARRPFWDVPQNWLR